MFETIPLENVQELKDEIVSLKAELRFCKENALVAQAELKKLKYQIELVLEGVNAY